MTDINQLGLVRINRCPTCEAQAAGMSRFTKAEEETLRKHVKHLSAKHVQIMHENVALQMENEKLLNLLRDCDPESRSWLDARDAALGETK